MKVTAIAHGGVRAIEISHPWLMSVYISEHEQRVSIHCESSESFAEVRSALLDALRQIDELEPQTSEVSA